MSTALLSWWVIHTSLLCWCTTFSQSSYHYSCIISLIELVGMMMLNIFSLPRVFQINGDDNGTGVVKWVSAFSTDTKCPACSYVTCRRGMICRITFSGLGVHISVYWFSVFREQRHAIVPTVGDCELWLHVGSLHKHSWSSDPFLVGCRTKFFILLALTCSTFIIFLLDFLTTQSGFQ